MLHSKPQSLAARGGASPPTQQYKYLLGSLNLVLRSPLVASAASECGRARAQAGKVTLIGEVTRPGEVTLEGNVTFLGKITIAGPFTLAGALTPEIR
jgi:hypothetical protein